MKTQKVNAMPLLTGLLFFLGSIGWQIIFYGEAKLADFIFAIILGLIVGTGSWYLARNKFRQK